MNRQANNITWLYAICFAFIFISQVALGQYEGGQGDGFTQVEVTTNCNFSSIYKGTAMDGFDFQSAFQTCVFNLFSSGGPGSGFASDTTTQFCLLDVIYTGDASDGYGYGFDSPCPLDSLIIDAEVIQQQSCTTSALGIAAVHVIDGYPNWQSTADYTYIWKNEAGDTLTGYPIVKSSVYDTLTNLATGEYTVIVYDANLKIDSATIYINDCLYRGGNGHGFASDSVQNTCTATSVYTNHGNDGFGTASEILACDNYLISKGGSGNGFAADTNIQYCLPPPVYRGETSDGYSSSNEILTCESHLFSTGGDGTGFSSDTVSQYCLPLNIYQSTQGDGFSFDTLILTCDISLFSTGGNGNGFSSDTATANCPALNIYQNSGNDGFDVVSDILNCQSVLFTKGGSGNGFSADTALQNCSIPNIFTGDLGDGYSLEYDIPCLKDSIIIVASVLDQITCPVTTDNGSAIVRITDGYPDWRSVPDYTYVWKNSVGDTLAGYPKTSSEIADTITNLGIDDYTIVVTDILGNVDSATIYITDCLYRGGNGPGFSTDSSLNICLAESVYKNTGYDGFDFAVDTPMCNSGLYSSGGNGNGFSVDTVLQNCNLLDIYKNTGEDGFDFSPDIQNCNMRLFSSGGNGNGFGVDTSINICSLPVITLGGSGDGADQFYNGCTPYIYDVPATFNNCLNADTIISNGSDTWRPIMLNGQIVAAIKDNGNNLGEIATQFFINDNSVRIDPFGILPSYYMNRNFRISAENLIYGAPVRLRLYFLSNELQSLITADDNVTSINTLGITQYHGTNENCLLTDNISNNDNLNYLHTSTYDWETYENGYFIEFDVTSFAEFYINNSSSLPSPYQIQADIAVTSDYNGADISCYGSTDGEATITPTYGMAPFTYQWDDPLSQTDSIATGLAAGTYHVTVVDNNNVTYMDSISISSPDSISISHISTNACAGNNNGTIDITASGGTVVTDYTYNWVTGDGSGLIAGDEDQFALTDGKYFITVEDNNACSRIDSITILELAQSTAPTGISITNNNTCPGSTKTLTPIGGFLGYNAQWNWYSDASCTSLLHTGSSFDVDPAISTSYWLRAEGDCDTTIAVSGTVLVLDQSTAPDSIKKSLDNIAPGTNDTLVVFGGNLGDGASWKWYLDAGCTSPAGPDNDTLFIAPATTTQYWVRAEGTCNVTAMVTTIVTINPLPLQPATPSGPDTLCQNNMNTSYITAGASGATSYVWTIDPPEAGTISGTGTTATVDWSASYYGTVSITVTGVNIAGSGPASAPLEIWLWKIPQSGGVYHISNTFAP
jgi:hypothetical protein